MLAAHRGTRTAGQQPEPVVQAVQNLCQRQRPHPCRRQFDRQGYPVEATADFAHRHGIFVADDEIRPSAAGPIDEQFDGFVGQWQ